MNQSIVHSSLIDVNQSDVHSSLLDMNQSIVHSSFTDMNQSDVLQWLDGRSAKNASFYNLWDRNFPKPVAKRFDCGLIVKGITVMFVLYMCVLIFNVLYVSDYKAVMVRFQIKICG
jgi:hypothetical protein